MKISKGKTIKCVWTIKTELGSEGKGECVKMRRFSVNCLYHGTPETALLSSVCVLGCRGGWFLL